MISALPRAGARRGARPAGCLRRRSGGFVAAHRQARFSMDALQQIGLRHPRIKQIRHITGSNARSPEQLLLAEGLWAHEVLVDLDAAIEMFLWCPEAAYSPEAHALSARVTARARCAYRISARSWTGSASGNGPRAWSRS